MKQRLTRERTLETLALLAAVSLLIYLISRKPVFVPLALGLLVLALVFKEISTRLAEAWLGFSEVIGNFNTRLVLGAVYFLCLTPLACVSRLFNGNSVKTGTDPSAKTYFEEKDHLYSSADMEKPW